MRYQTTIRCSMVLAGLLLTTSADAGFVYRPVMPVYRPAIIYRPAMPVYRPVPVYRPAPVYRPIITHRVPTRSYRAPARSYRAARPAFPRSATSKTIRTPQKIVASKPTRPAIVTTPSRSIAASARPAAARPSALKPAVVSGWAAGVGRRTTFTAQSTPPQDASNLLTGGTGQAQCAHCQPGVVYDHVSPTCPSCTYTFNANAPGCASNGSACWIPANPASSGPAASLVPAPGALPGRVNPWIVGATIPHSPDIYLPDDIDVMADPGWYTDPSTSSARAPASDSGFLSAAPTGSDAQGSSIAQAPADAGQQATLQFTLSDGTSMTVTATKTDDGQYIFPGYGKMSLADFTKKIHADQSNDAQSAAKNPSAGSETQSGAQAGGAGVDGVDKGSQSSSTSPNSQPATIAKNPADDDSQGPHETRDALYDSYGLRKPICQPSSACIDPDTGRITPAGRQWQKDHYKTGKFVP